METEEKRSLVIHLDLEMSPTTCGYCGKHGSICQGLVFDSLTVSDYKALLDRGWRRCGRYVYKPTMEETCCPLYTIRCDAAAFQPSKSQRKVIKKVQNYLHHGPGRDDDSKRRINVEATPTPTPSPLDEEKRKTVATNDGPSPEGGNPRRVEGLLKSKVMRKQKYFEKLLKAGQEVSQKDNQGKFNKSKELKDLMPEHNNFVINKKILQSEENSRHKFELRLVKADLSDAEFMSSLKESYEVYRKYQIQIHKEAPEDCNLESYAEFLCDSPLVRETDDELGLVYGSYHQQYLVDDSIVCVAVLDLLPGCVSSVYLYYHPHWWGAQPSLSPGTYSALREIQLTQRLGLPYYYMGFYIHHLNKMRYKGRFLPSQLLSPSLLSWHDITLCCSSLETQQLSTFQTVPCIQEPPMEGIKDIEKLKIYYKKQVLKFSDYKKECSTDVSDVEKYHNLVGQSLAEKMMLRRTEFGAFYYDSESEEDEINS